MTLDLFRMFTPYITFFLAIGTGVLGWFVRWMVLEHNSNFREIREEIVRLEIEIKDLEKGRMADQKYLFEQYVDKESFYLAVGKMDGLISRIFDQLTELNRTVHQMMGVIKNHEG